MTNRTPDELEQFYVQFHPASGKYRTESGELGAYANAERFGSRSLAVLTPAEGYQWVGPCIPGEEP